MRIKPETILEMESMIKQGISINSISHKLNLGKSTIYYHYNKILGKKIKIPHFVKKDLEEEGEIIGAFAADGSSCPQRDYQITYFFSSDEENYAYSFSILLESYFNKKPYVYRLKNQNVIIVRYRSKIIYLFIREYLEWKNPKTYSVKLKSLEQKTEFLNGFLRGYLDCDGYTEKIILELNL